MIRKFSEELPEVGQLIRVEYPNSSEFIVKYDVDVNGDGIVFAIGIPIYYVSKLTTWQPIPDYERLAMIISDNRGCRVIIDNDNWQIYKALPKDWEDWDYDQQDEWIDNEGIIANDSEFPELGISYGYGVLEALAHIVGITVENT